MTDEQLRNEANHAVLELFAAHTALPIGLYEKKGNEFVATFPNQSLEIFERYCKLIRQTSQGQAACDRDQCARAAQSFANAKPQLNSCYAGIWNQSLPIVVDSEVQAVLLLGEMLIDDQQHMQETLDKHSQAMRELGLGQEIVDTLHGALMEVKKKTLGELKDFRERLLPIETYLYTMISREQDMEHNLQKVVHELQTRLQSVIMHSENIMLEVNTLKPKQIHEMAHKLLSSAEAMATIVNNLGDFQQSYTWRPEKIRPLFIEAWRTYNSEALERNIKLRVNFIPVDGKEPEIEMSRQHLELAVNNLMHNAIKYSFHGGANRERFVEVDGAPEDNYYRISISNYGVGIEAEEIERGLIFKDGYQGHLTQGENRTGSGKGLVFVKRVVDRHHGSIKVESIPMGKKIDFVGQPHLNKFTISLPFKQPEMEASNG